MFSRHLVVALGSALPAWAAWSVTRPLGMLPAFLGANLAFAIGWYYSRKFVREHLDL